MLFVWALLLLLLLCTSSSKDQEEQQKSSKQQRQQQARRNCKTQRKQDNLLTLASACFSTKQCDLE